MIAWAQHDCSFISRGSKAKPIGKAVAYSCGETIRHLKREIWRKAIIVGVKRNNRLVLNPNH
jgi:hypothetical protein